MEIDYNLEFLRLEKSKSVKRYNNIKKEII